ncbi:DUF4181 domain-containing protein [Lysinibacillus sp. NPDC048646]|uniref:DUF4181 domain-containing protein n=1 Tax=Lysinibacillus sp. NPDC048646 TaxID=3390574 RepID=UPI003CFD5C7C
MTSFKDKLNKEIGEAPRFTQQLQERIFHKAKQQSMQNRWWHYSTVMVAATLTLLFFIAIGPWKSENASNLATIVDLAKREEIKQFSIAVNWENNQFKAGRSGWVVRQREYDKGLETELFENVLQKAVLSKKDDNYSAFRDIWIEFDNKQTAKLKILLNVDQLAFIDIKTNVFYKVNDLKVASEFIAFSFKEDSTINSSWIPLSIFLVVIILVAWRTERIIRKKFNIPKEQKYVSKSHQRTMYIVHFINFIMLLVFIIKNWVIYIAAAMTIILVSLLFYIAIDYYYGREEKRHYISITSGLLTLVLFLGFILIGYL